MKLDNNFENNSVDKDSSWKISSVILRDCEAVLSLILKLNEALSRINFYFLRSKSKLLFDS